jgi:hypothetical protein
MNALKNSLIACGLLGIASLASAQVNLPDPTLPGSSMNNAVRIVATSELMIDRFIKRWLRTHYPGWDADQIDLQDMGDERFAVVNISTANQPSRRVYFRLVQNPQDPDAREGGVFPF